MKEIQFKKYGWMRDIPDFRDLQFNDHFSTMEALPSIVDLRPQMPPVYDQGQLGSCTANAIGAAIQYELTKQNLPSFTPSRLFIYYNERSMEGTINSDSGAMIRDGIKSINLKGACPEDLWPYDISKFTKKPVVKTYTIARKHKGVKYYSVPQTENDIKTALAQGFPVVFGFGVYTYFESADMAKTGVLNMPGQGEQMLGGHAVLIVGYKDDTRQFIVRNSWSANWGQAGYFYMPYDYVTNNQLADDFWVIQQMSG